MPERKLTAVLRVFLTALTILVARVPLSSAAVPTLSTIYDFQGGTDGSGPTSELVADKAGNLYGVTTNGGLAGDGCTSGCGTVFQLSPPVQAGAQWTKTVLHQFLSTTDPNGALPIAALTIDKSGVLYGTTSRAFTTGSLGGTVFSMTPPAQGQTGWTFATVHQFGAPPFRGSDGAYPLTRLLLGKGGVLYGTTGTGDPGTGSVVFQLTPPAVGQTGWAYRFLFTNVGGSSNSSTTGLISDAAGDLYGNIYNGDQGSMMYKLVPVKNPRSFWDFSIVTFFADQNHTGSLPTGEICMDTAGVIYGTTTDSGLSAHPAGIVYSVVPPPPGVGASPRTILHSFMLGNTGAYPQGGVTADKFGKLYGTTQGYSNHTQPVLGASAFELVPPAPGDTVWDWKKLATFDGTNGASPMSSLVIAPNGKLYGTTTQGGAYGYGTAFELTR